MRGFTLTELLVVVSILGILMAILIPAIGAATKAGKEAVQQEQVEKVPEVSKPEIIGGELQSSFPWVGFIFAVFASILVICGVSYGLFRKEIHTLVKNFRDPNRLVRRYR